MVIVNFDKVLLIVQMTSDAYLGPFQISIMEFMLGKYLKARNR